MTGGRFLTEEERELIKKNKAKEKEYIDYKRGAVLRMAPKKSEYKIKSYASMY